MATLEHPKDIEATAARAAQLYGQSDFIKLPPHVRDGWRQAVRLAEPNGQTRMEQCAYQARQEWEHERTE